MFYTGRLYTLELSFIRKDLGFVQTRDQELPIALLYFPETFGRMVEVLFLTLDPDGF